MNNNLKYTPSDTTCNSSGANNNDKTQKILKNSPWRYYNDYFIVISVQDENLNVQCITCKKQYSVHKWKLSSLQNHMQKKHPIKFEQFLNDASSTGSNKSKKRNIPIDSYNSLNSKKFHQTPLERFESENSIEEFKNSLSGLIFKLIIETTQPIVLSEFPEHTSINFLCTPRENIITIFDEMKINLISTLDLQLWVSITADCWTQTNQNFISITCHWIDIETLKKKSAMLACSQINRKYTHNIIAQKMFSIFQEYRIANKVLLCTTGNSSNVIKPFAQFNKQQSSEDHKNDINCIDLCEILDELKIRNDLDGVHLPLHRRCIFHSLNLIAIYDINETLSKLDKKSVYLYTQTEKHLQQYREVYKNVITKIEKLWNKQNESNVITQKIYEQFDVYIKAPDQTFWNGLYYGIKQINDLLNICKGIDKFHNIFDFCSIPRFRPEEVDFIQEYIDVMKPLADSLDFFQTKESIYMGYLLPTLYSLEKKYINLKHNNYTFFYCLIDTIILAIKKRFEPIWVEKNLIIAACLLPQFKLRWLDDIEMYHEAKEWLEEEFQKFTLELENSSDSNDDNNDLIDDFFSIQKFNNKRKPKESSQTQLSKYLNNTSRKMKSLMEYPQVKKLFVYYNVGLPSSAPVDILFSSTDGAQIRQQLGINSVCEKLFLIRCNKHLSFKNV